MTTSVTRSGQPSDQSEVRIRQMTPQDWPDVSSIFTEGIKSGHATFEAAAPEWGQFNASRLRDHRLVAEIEGKTLGWAAVSPVSARAAYAGVVEHSIYVAGEARGLGMLTDPTAPPRQAPPRGA